MKKPFPDLKTDEEAEHFVESADLSDYDFSDMVPVRFELKRKDPSISFHLPEDECVLAQRLGSTSKQ